MPDPITFTSACPRYRLPLLFSGQTQKEFYVNEAHALADALLHPAVEGTRDDPPAAPGEGECWRVGESPEPAWAGHAGCLACFIADSWLFIEPRDGLKVLDTSTGQFLLYRGGWQVPAAQAEPIGGATVDTEARAAIASLIAVLSDAGILPVTP